MEIDNLLRISSDSIEITVVNFPDGSNSLLVMTPIKADRSSNEPEHKKYALPPLSISMPTKTALYIQSLHLFVAKNMNNS